MNSFDSMINGYPRQSLQITFLLAVFIWQSPVAIAGLTSYVLLAKNLKIKWWLTLPAGIAIAWASSWIQHANLHALLIQEWHVNIACWHALIGDSKIPYQALFYSLIAYTLLFCGLFDMLNLIRDPAHYATVKALQKGIETSDTLEIDDKKMNGLLSKCIDYHAEGTVLGISKYTGNPVIVPDRYLNQVMLVLGTTGSGKTITLRRFYQRAIVQGYPLIIVDGKPDAANIAGLQALAERYQRRFIGFNCANYLAYDPLAKGGYTELKDKIISLKDEWSSDHYKSIAEDYLQTTMEVLIKAKEPFDLKRVAECLAYEELALLARRLNDPIIMKRVASLEQYERTDITGLQAHLNILIRSELGSFFDGTQERFTLHEAIQQNAVIYFSLPALRFPSFAKVLGKLVINDIKSVIDRENYDKRIFTVFDEFSVFAGEQVLNLVNMGRGKGIHAIFGTQGLADLDKVDDSFKKQVMNCVNTLICHRLNDQDSAEEVANWVGTKDVFNVTAQINVKEGDAAMGTVKKIKEFLVHPNSIKQTLCAGEIFFISKIDKFSLDKIRVLILSFLHYATDKSKFYK